MKFITRWVHVLCTNTIKQSTDNLIFWWYKSVRCSRLSVLKFSHITTLRFNDFGIETSIWNCWLNVTYTHISRHCWWLYNVTHLRYKKFKPCLTQVLLLKTNSMRFVEETIELLWNNYCCVSAIVSNLYQVVKTL